MPAAEHIEHRLVEADRAFAGGGRLGGGSCTSCLAVGCAHAILDEQLIDEIVAAVGAAEQRLTQRARGVAHVAHESIDRGSKRRLLGLVLEQRLIASHGAREHVVQLHQLWQLLGVVDVTRDQERQVGEQVHEIRHMNASSLVLRLRQRRHVQCREVRQRGRRLVREAFNILAWCYCRCC